MYLYVTTVKEVMNWRRGAQGEFKGGKGGEIQYSYMKFSKNKKKQGAREKAQRLRALVTCAEDPI